MPWRGAEVDGEFPTLGYLVADWIQEHCVIPDGDHAGDPYVLTDEMLWFLLEYYRLDPDRPSTKWDGPRFRYGRGGQLVRPQKWGKGPFSAAIICAEAEGPVVPAGWDADGEPVGRPWSTPLIQVTAISEDQSDNVWSALVPMVQLGELAADIPDTGLTRINLEGGGKIEPVTASAKSRLGQRITFAVQDEPHSYLERNGGRALADTQRRNLAGMGGRFLETGNAWDPAEQSVAQLTNENPVGVYVDFPVSPPGSVKNRRERRRVMRHLYRQCWWVDVDRIDEEVEALLKHDPAQAERFFLNRTHAASGAALDAQKWATLARPTSALPAGKRLITLGVDGARFDDALAIIATDVELGHQWPVTIVERPPTADEDYEHDFDAVDGAVVDVWNRHRVWRAYCDPQYIEPLVDRWQGRWGDKRVIKWYTNRPKPIAYAVRAYRHAIAGDDLTHDGDEVFARHVANARRDPLTVKDDDGRPMFSMRKDRAGSPNKIDAAMAGCVSWEARGDCIAAGALEKWRRRGQAVFL